MSKDLCLIFNPTETINSALESIGFHLEIFIEKKINGQIPFVYLMVNNRNYVTVNEIGISLPTEFKTRIAISKTNDVKLPEPYNQCMNLKSIDDYHTELYKKTFRKFNSYSRE